MKRKTTKTTPRPAIPAEIYLAQVDSLFQEERTLLVGYVTVVGSILLTFWRSGDIALPAAALLFTAITVARAIGMRAYARAKPDIKTVDGGAPVGGSVRRRRGVVPGDVGCLVLPDAGARG